MRELDQDDIENIREAFRKFDKSFYTAYNGSGIKSTRDLNSQSWNGFWLVIQVINACEELKDDLGKIYGLNIKEISKVKNLNISI